MDKLPGRKSDIAVDYAVAVGSAGKADRKVAHKWEVDASLPALYLEQTKARDLYVKRLGRNDNIKTKLVKHWRF